MSEIILGVVIGVAVALGLIYLYIQGLTKQILSELNQHLERAEAAMMPVVVERHNGEIFCYGEEDKQFICQGKDLAEIKAAIKLRFPDKVAYLAGGDEELVKELREAMIRDKVEGILAQAELAAKE